MPLAGQQKRAVVEQFQIHKTDVGSPEVQIAVLSERIAQLTEHFRAFPKDHASRHGLLTMVSKRRRHLEYLKKHDIERYKLLITKMGSRQ